MIKKTLHTLMIFAQQLILLVLSLVVLNACGGSKDSPAPPPITSPTKGAASGTLTIPPSNTVEIEPNNAIRQAQRVVNNTTVSGVAASGEAGYPLPGVADVTIQDLYALSVSGKTRILLSIAEDDLSENDLDLFLMDEAGLFINGSEGFISTEFIETTGAGNFIIGIRGFKGRSAYVLSFSALGSLGGLSDIAPVGADFVAGDILLKTQASGPGNQKHNLDWRDRYALTEKMSFGEGHHLMQIIPKDTKVSSQKPSGPQKLNRPGSSENVLKARTLETIRALQQDEGIQYAEPNFIRHALKVPNDTYYNIQWHSDLINLPEAWDVTTGDDNVIVAVIDTGILSNHPDLNNRLIDGYDFISNTTTANDGDGIDNDPEDPGDDPEQASSSFHGTHVTGTIAATSDNAFGVSGVTWQGKVMPLRALGVGGGTTSDIDQAILYAAGLPNSSGLLPAQKADIINMSLGGPGFSQSEQDTITSARNAGVTIVAAAGNDNASTLSYPASYDGVVSVSAVDSLSQKAPYSNFGTGVDVAAPGGDGALDNNADGFGDAVLSTWATEVTDAGGDVSITYGYGFSQGTSMASPHVAGVFALMLAVNPELTPDDFDLLLSGNHSQTTTRITLDRGASGRDDFFGEGLIDASQAVIAAQQIPGGTGILPSGSILKVATSGLNFYNYLDTLSFDISNAGVNTLSITSVTDNAEWLSLNPSSGLAPLALTAIVDRESLSPGDYTATITLNSDAEAGSSPIATVSVVMTVGGETAGDVGTIFVQIVDPESAEIVAVTRTSANNNYAFSLPNLPPGEYSLVAGTDRDSIGEICDIEDACGTYPGTVIITANEETKTLDFIVRDLLSPQ